MNSYNGYAYGTEAWIYSTNSKSYAVAKRLTQNYAKLGFYNRGVKISTGLYDLRKSVAPAIILETCFCDSKKDIDVWKSTSWQQLAKQICNAI
ncbi:N-acetylmuramoyl-L-alanine amidase [Clostridium botulinum]|uniref:N-acetylmuramoyl-L-alanine amidase n=1 Tax=Clostridium botulinum TaxID=1491 RepID=UPI003DA690C9